MKKFFVMSGAMVALVAALVLFGFVRTIESEAPNTQAVVVTIESGKSVQDIADILDERGVISSPLAFRAYALVSGRYGYLTSGVFRFEPEVNIREVVKQLSSGDTADEIRIVLLEGWGIRDIAKYLADEVGVVAEGDFVVAAHTTDSRTIIPDTSYDFFSSKPVNQDLEGYLFPDTYSVYIDSTPADIIHKMLDNFDQKLTPEMRAQAAEQGLSIHELVTIASLIEKEVQRPEDKRIVAGIIFNRLANGQALQLDSTVNFLTQTGKSQSSLADLQIDSPYNTYVYPGLPPGPIANPGLDALQAVLNPTASNYNYFITDVNGVVYYSATFEEHVQKKNQLYP